MKFLNLDYIKKHSRIDYDIGDDMLELYAESAEEVLLCVLNRSYDDLVSTYGAVPKPIMHAGLMLVDLSYANRSPVSTQNLYEIPYTLEFLIKPYIIL